jgi:lipopolysaccharide/colanic/teichoic acid biosynthesis glycosyltransferase
MKTVATTQIANPRATPNQTIVKRAMDIGGALFIIILLLPLFLFIGALVFGFEGRPIIYRRRVVGLKGEFDAFKFRTMCQQADRVLKENSTLQAEYLSNFKLKADPRVTTLGKVLRKYSLDELPQLFNVLAGQMSLVGPRMITAPELAKYGDYQLLLLTVKPGITGYWQVYGRQDVSYAERVRMDVEYINNWSVRLDLSLLALTPLRVILGKGAY